MGMLSTLVPPTGANDTAPAADTLFMNLRLLTFDGGYGKVPNADTSVSGQAVDIRNGYPQLWPGRTLILIDDSMPGYNAEYKGDIQVALIDSLPGRRVNLKALAAGNAANVTFLGRLDLATTNDDGSKVFRGDLYVGDQAIQATLKVLRQPRDDNDKGTDVARPNRWGFLTLPASLLPLCRSLRNGNATNYEHKETKDAKPPQTDGQNAQDQGKDTDDIPF